MNCTDPG